MKRHCVDCGDVFYTDKETANYCPLCWVTNRLGSESSQIEAAQAIRTDLATITAERDKLKAELEELKEANRWRDVEDELPTPTNPNRPIYEKVIARFFDSDEEGFEATYIPIRNTFEAVGKALRCVSSWKPWPVSKGPDYV